MEHHASPLWTLQRLCFEPDVAADPSDRGENRDPDSATETIKRLLTRRTRLENAPTGARKIIENERRLGWVLPSVRPLMRPVICRGPVWEFANQVQIRAACSRHCVANWLPGSVAPTLAPYSPSDRPYTFDDLSAASELMPPRPELCRHPPSLRWPRRSAPSCWPVPRSPASAACEPECVQAMIPPARPACMLGVRPRSRR